MKRTVKKLTAAFLTATMTFVSLPQKAIAEPAPQEADILAAGDWGDYQDFGYEELEDGTIAITYYAGSDTEVTIPAEINGKKVTMIWDYAFWDCDFLKSVSFPDSLTSIGNYAFEHCDLLETVSFPEKLAVIGDMAFWCCFSLTEIIIPGSVTEIGEEAFGICDHLINIQVDESNKNYKDIDGVLFSKDETTIVKMPEARYGSYSIPKGVTVIGTGAFDGACYLEEIILPNSLKTIGNNAFSNCEGLTEMIIPEGVTAIGNRAFESCNNLSFVTIPESVLTIGNSAFYYCNVLTDVTLPSNLEVIGDHAFGCCKSFEEIIIPDSVTSVGEGAFSYCDYLSNISVGKDNKNYKDINGVLLTKDGKILIQYPSGILKDAYTIPDGVTTIICNAFSGSCLTKIDCPNSLTTIDEYAFSGCYALVEVNLPDSLTTIGDCAFLNCNILMEINFPDSLITIGNRAFLNCSCLTNIVLPDNLTTIGEYAFAECYSLLSVTIPASVTEMGFGVFYDCPPDMVVYGFIGSYAENYVEGYCIKFIPLNGLIDEKTGVAIITGEKSLPANTQLNVEQTEQTVTSLSYNITLTQNGKEIQPEGDVTVRIPVPSGWGGEEIYVYRKEADGSLTDMNAVISGVYISFTTDHFSEYVVSTKSLATVLLGDVNHDGKINTTDARWVLQAISGSRTLIDEERAAADVNKDGKINTADAKWILQAVSGSRKLG